MEFRSGVETKIVRTSNPTSGGNRRGVLIVPQTVSPLTSATFTFFAQIYLLWNNISSQNFTFSEVSEATDSNPYSIPFCFPSPNFNQKLDAAAMCTTISLALVPAYLIFQNYSTPG